MEQGRRDGTTVVRERAILVACLLPGNTNDPQDPLGELRSLADTAGAVVVDELIQNRHKPVAGTFMGTGKVKELAELVKANGADVVIFDNELSPAQISNLDEEVGCKIIDRSELILDIFAARARTHEAKLQVELAQLIYTYPRLRAMWTHLERIAGGAPMGIGTRGPGEQQLEVDRRIVQRRRSELKREIEIIQGRKDREVAQRNQDHYTVCLVGYTNAGKSTMFNSLTDGGAYADDKLFATLSTRTRLWSFGGGEGVMLSDTVGFVRDLPHHLVASFKATLTEAVHADLLLLVLDVAHPRASQQLDTVLKVLNEIGANTQPRVLLLNKVDKLEHNADLLVLQSEFPESMAVSAKTGAGLDKLRDYVRDAARGGMRRLRIAVDMSDGKAINFLETRAQVLDRQYEGRNAVYLVLIGTRQLDQLHAMGAKIQVVDEVTA
jgi:GTP-binding protein HflX